MVQSMELTQSVYVQVLPLWSIAIATFVLLVITALIVTARQHRRHARETAPRHCAHCGLSHPAYSRFCRQCGKRIDTAER